MTTAAAAPASATTTVRTMTTAKSWLLVIPKVHRIGFSLDSTKVCRASVWLKTSNPARAASAENIHRVRAWRCVTRSIVALLSSPGARMSGPGPPASRSTARWNAGICFSPPFNLMNTEGTMPNLAW